MSDPSEELVTIYGATGYTGRLCARAAVEAGLRVRLAGRRQDALAELAAELGGDIEIAVADAADAEALRALAATTAVLVTTVGPYEDLGRAVLNAAIDGGAHYVDISGEASFLEWAYDQSERAAAAGIVLCPGFGFDGVPGELLAALAAVDLGGAVREARVGYLVRGGRVSAGTARSAAEIASRGGLALVGGRLVAEAPLSSSWSLPFPPPLGARPGVSVPGPEVVTLGRSLGVVDARTYFAVVDLPGATAGAGLFGRVVSLAAQSPLWNAVRAGTQWLPEGPTEERRAKTRCAVVAEVTGADRSARAWLRLTDLYGATASIVVATVRRLLMGGIEPGARTPSQLAGNPILFLDEIGADWERLPL